jgi:hypothetical protein
MSTTWEILAMFGDQEPNMYATSGALPPRTAVRTFCSTKSLEEYSSLTLTSGWDLSYWSIRPLNASPSVSWYPCQTAISTGPDDDEPPPPPHAASTNASVATRAMQNHERNMGGLLLR